MAAACVMHGLGKLAPFIVSHVNPVGLVGGKVRPGSMTEAATQALRLPVHLPLPGKTTAFDAGGLCTAVC